MNSGWTPFLVSYFLKPYHNIDGFELIFINCLKSAAFSFKTSGNNLKSPWNQFKSNIKVHQLTNTRGSYVHKPMVKFSGASQIFFLCVCKFLKQIDVLDKTIHKAFRIHKTL